MKIEAGDSKVREYAVKIGLSSKGGFDVWQTPQGEKFYFWDSDPSGNRMIQIATAEEIYGEKKMESLEPGRMSPEDARAESVRRLRAAGQYIRGSVQNRKLDHISFASAILQAAEDASTEGTPIRDIIYAIGEGFMSVYD